MGLPLLTTKTDTLLKNRANNPYKNSTKTMLDLPDGTVLFHRFSNQFYTYKPAGKPIYSGAPSIDNVTANGDGSYHVTGTGFSGISEGAAYGDDWQMNTNYPIARLTDTDGDVFYCRTYNWSSNSLMTGSLRVSTDMTLPVGLPDGNYQLNIVVNGNPSTDVYHFRVKNGVSLTYVTVRSLPVSKLRA